MGGILQLLPSPTVLVTLTLSHTNRHIVQTLPHCPDALCSTRGTVIPSENATPIMFIGRSARNLQHSVRRE